MTPARLIHLRKSLGLTQTEAAALIGAGLKSWQNWEAETGREQRAIPKAIGILFELLADGTIDENDIARVRG